MNLEGKTDLVIQMKNQSDIYLFISENFGLHIVNLSDFNNPFEISYALNNITGKVDGIDITKDQNYCISVIQNKGLVIYNISDILNPKFIKILVSYSIQFSKLSQKNDNIVYIAEGNQGFSIVDITNKNEPLWLIYFIGQEILGWSCKLTFNKDETLIYVTQLIDNSLLQINISNIIQPNVHYILSQNLQAFSIAITMNQDYIFLGIGQGLICFPLKSSNNIQEIFLIDNSQNYIFINQYDDYQILYVGQQVTINTPLLFNPQNRQIKQLMLLKDFKFVDLPSNMIFEGNNLNIQLNQQNEGIVEINYQIYSKILISDIIQNNFTLIQAQQIYNILQKINYIDNNGYPSQNLDIYQYIIHYQDYFEDQYLNSVQNMLLNNIDNYKIIMKVYPSLRFFPQGYNQTYIQTLSKQNVQITFLVDLKYGKFPYLQQFDSLFVEISQKEDLLKLIGPVDILNQQLSLCLIKFYAVENFVENQTQYQNIQIKLDDSLNNVQTYSHNVKQLTFLQMYQKLQIQDTIQQYFNEQYPEGQIKIQEDIQFIIPMDSFFSEVTPELIILIKNNDKFEQLSDFNWVKLQSHDSYHLIYGTPQQSEYKKEVILQIKVFDKYDTVVQELRIYPVLIPIALIITYIVTVLGPLFSIIGMIKYRQQLYNILCKKKFQRSIDFAILDKPYIKIIPIIKDDLQHVNNLYSQFTKYNEFQLNNFINSQGFFNYNAYQNFIEFFISKNQNSHIMKKDLLDQECDIHKIFRLKMIYQYHLTQPDLQQLYYQFKKKSQQKYIHDWYKTYIQFEYKQIQEYQRQDKKSVFPKIIFFTDIIRQKLQKILEKQQIIINRYISQTDLLNYQQNFIDNSIQIILECMEADIIGIVDHKILQFTYGESINAQTKTIKEISAWKKDTKGSCLKIKKILNSDFVELGIQENYKLPLWLKCEMKFGLIFLYGTPTLETADNDNVYIRIISQTGIILMQFQIYVEQSIYKVYGIKNESDLSPQKQEDQFFREKDVIQNENNYIEMQLQEKLNN